jgi:hypothetical protein
MVREHRARSGGTTLILGDDDRLSVTGNPFADTTEPADTEVAGLFDRLLDVARIAEATLTGPERRAVLEIVFGGLVVVLDHAGSPVTADRLRASVHRAESRLAVAGARRALQRYLEGMLIGLVLVLVVAGLARLGLIYVIRDTVPGTMYFPTILVAGAFGAVLSVLTRITRGAIRVPAGGRDREIRLLGALRPIVGVVLGAAVAVVLLSDVLPVKLPEGDVRAFWVVGIAFLAGFLERFAQEIPGPGR